ncbi:unnamed protein product, partial [Polarella glacialis]
MAPPVASDEKYVPGRGTDRAARERLKYREGLDAELPKEDDSKQTDILLGNGAKKVARCGKCTRPLDDVALQAKQFVCSRCTGGLDPSIVAAAVVVVVIVGVVVVVVVVVV